MSWLAAVIFISSLLSSTTGSSKCLKCKSFRWVPPTGALDDITINPENDCRSDDQSVLKKYATSSCPTDGEDYICYTMQSDYKNEIAAPSFMRGCFFRKLIPDDQPAAVAAVTAKSTACYPYGQSVVCLCDGDYCNSWGKVFSKADGSLAVNITSIVSPNPPLIAGSTVASSGGIYANNSEQPRATSGSSVGAHAISPTDDVRSLPGRLIFVVVGAGAVMFLVNSSPTVTDGDRWGLGFLPSAIFTIGLTKITRAELYGFGTGSDNAFPRYGYSFGSSVFSLMIDVVVFGLVAVYLEPVIPSDDKQKQPPWFFVLPSYWVKSQKPASPTTTPITSTDIESVPLELRQKTAIISRNLRKDFRNKSGAAAVEDFTYEVYEDEILAVLGHNGAGKTTLLRMLVGLPRPTSVHAYIYGQDIIDPEQLKVAQTMIGICPQHDVLFDTLTVKEHIVFYTRLKGFSDQDADNEYERVVGCIDMHDQADNKARNLSGGQKRRLCIAIAIAGDPKVLMLDEPTSGVDPFTRSFIWDMIRTFKKGRCVIVTTHSMQEADIHCERKLIFSHGRIRCAGSSLFLKNRYGAGYHLTMSVEREFNETQITEFVASRIPGAKTARVHGGEISFKLPKDAASKFQKVFSDLDKSLASLKIRSYGISETSLEEIFLKLAEELPPDVIANGFKSTTNPKSAVAPAAKLLRPKKGAVSSGVKFLKLCRIRFLLAMRSKLFWFFQLVLPLILLILVGVILQAKNNAAATAEVVEYLPMAKVGAAMKDTGIPPASNENAEKNPVVASMEALVGQKFDEIPYDQLEQNTPHLMSFEFFEPASMSKEQQKNYTDLAANLSALGVAVIPPVILVYNGSSTHVLPYAANMLLNAIFRHITGKAETFEVSINPFPDIVEKSREDAGGLGIESFFIGFVSLLIPGIYCVDVCRDRTLKLRSQIRMTSCSTWLYWGSAFVSHLIQYIGTFILAIIVMYGFKPCCHSHKNLWRTMLGF